jgi:GNAT superfamily N-acetyltransferase
VADTGVRSARIEDAQRIGALQAHAWRYAYADLLPADVLAGLEPAALAEGWEASLTSAPSPRHRVLAAYAGSRDDVVGFAAYAPATDTDLDPSTDAEVSALVVAPDATRAGHGSRLLAAAVEHLRADGFTHAHLWASEPDRSLTEFLRSAGWGEDGATRSLDLRGDGGVVVEQVRLHTDVSQEAP